jgi:hypothetical protein
MSTQQFGRNLTSKRLLELINTGIANQLVICRSKSAVPSMFIKITDSYIHIIDFQLELDQHHGWIRTKSYALLTVERTAFGEMMGIKARHQNIADTHVRKAVTEYLQTQSQQNPSRIKKWEGHYQIVYSPDILAVKAVIAWIE